MINIQVAYATKEKQKVIDLQIEEGSTIEQAIDNSNILNYFNIKLENLTVGIYSKKKTLDTILKEGDRVELYRDLPEKDLNKEK